MRHCGLASFPYRKDPHQIFLLITMVRMVATIWISILLYLLVKKGFEF